MVRIETDVRIFMGPHRIGGADWERHRHLFAAGWERWLESLRGYLEEGAG